MIEAGVRVMRLVTYVYNDLERIGAVHGIEIIEAAYKAADTGITQYLKTTFDPLPLDQLAEI